jgi:hypothetical protein
MQSLLATQRSLLVHEAHNTAKEKRQNRNLRANATMTGGMPGQRKRKLEGNREEHETTARKKIQPTVSGAHRTTEILKEALNSQQASGHIWKEERNEIKKKLFERGNTYDNKRIEAKIEIYDKKRSTHKEPNQIQRQAPGMDLTALVVGRIPFSRVKFNAQKENVLEELRRRLSDEVVLRRDLSSLGVKALVDNFLRPDEIEQMGQDVDDFDPKHKVLDEWGIKWKCKNQN